MKTTRGLEMLEATPHGALLLREMLPGTDYMWMPARQLWVVANPNHPPFLFNAQTGERTEIKPEAA